MPSPSRHRPRNAVVIACVLLSLAGCVGAPTSTPSSSSQVATTGSGNQRHSAPPLTEPELSISPFMENPCGLLGRAYLHEVDITVTGQVESTALGKSCRWNAAATPVRVDFSLTINTQSGGLDKVYADKDKMKVWRPFEIRGYPAVHADESNDADLGQCRMSVAVTKTILLAIALRVTNRQVPDHINPCGRGKAILERAIRALKAKL